MTFQCEYCKKQFARETSIEVHMCEPKRRRLDKNERGVELGFQAYIRFYETMQGSAKLKTYDDFCIISVMGQYYPFIQRHSND